MNNKYILVGVTILAAIVTFALSRVIWPDPAGMAGPSANLVPYFLFLSALESIAFGMGVSFLLFGYSRVRNLLPESPKLARASFIAVAWMLISWWPHDNMHRVNGMDFPGLLRIEFIFHFTLIISAFILATFLSRLLVKNSTNTSHY